MCQIVSPHIDDAFLSLGGIISSWSKKDLNPTILYVFSVSSWTSDEAISGKKYPHEQKDITRLRKNEEALVKSQLRYDCLFLDFPDASVRTHAAESPAQNAHYEQVKQTIREHIMPDQECFFPLGLGHPDHAIIRNIGFELLEDCFNVKFYEDLPYMSYQQSSLESIYTFLTSLGLRPVSRAIDWEQKLKTIRCYESQISEAWLRAISCYSYSPFDNTYYERYWEVGDKETFSFDTVRDVLLKIES